MTIDEAIKILTQLERILSPTMAARGTDAIRLGIEALKARKVWQDEEGFNPAEALPGETEE